MGKIRVGILCGGKSEEHEVSLQSAKNIIDAIDGEKYEIVVIGIDKLGQWSIQEPSLFLHHADDPKRISLRDSKERVTLSPGGFSQGLLKASKSLSAGPIDVVFPVLHGPFGEDGTVQGLLKLADVPFVGAGVLGSAVGMDKDVMKRLLRDAGIPIGKFLVLHRDQKEKITFKDALDQLGLPLFIKPANYGSSIGISMVNDENAFNTGLEEAFRFDRKIVIEAYIEGREIECSVLGNDDPIASIPGEIIPQKAFYSYESKYIDESGALLKVPADLDERIAKRLRDLAVRTFRVLCCEGMARVDMFLKEDHEIFVNEINTIPGFTKISMYPRLWEESGISYGELIDRLIELALERFKTD